MKKRLLGICLTVVMMFARAGLRAFTGGDGGRWGGLKRSLTQNDNRNVKGMSDNSAARQGDEIIHSSIFADITSIVAEGAAYAVIGAAVGAAATVAAPLLGAGAAAAGVAAIGSSCLLSGIIGGVLANVAGITDDISNAAEGLGNALFPPSPAGKITTGSDNVLTNAIPAARAAGTLTPADTPSPEPQSPGSFADYCARR